MLVVHVLVNGIVKMSKKVKKIPLSALTTETSLVVMMPMQQLMLLSPHLRWLQPYLLKLVWTLILSPILSKELMVSHLLRTLKQLWHTCNLNISVQYPFFQHLRSNVFELHKYTILGSIRSHVYLHYYLVFTNYILKIYYVLSLVINYNT